MGWFNLPHSVILSPPVTANSVPLLPGVSSFRWKRFVEQILEWKSFEGAVDDDHERACVKRGEIKGDQAGQVNQEVDCG